MFNLLYKELRLAAHPTLYFFIFLGFLVIVPSYPFGLIFFFGSLAPFITFLFGRETCDNYYTALLPIKKTDVVKGKCLLVVFVQILQLIISVPIAILRAYLPIGENVVGIEANIAYYGFGLTTFAIFNFIFFTQFYKTAYKVGKSFIIAIIPVIVCIFIMELLSHVPTIYWLDSIDPEYLIRQIPILIIGIIVYTVGIICTYFLAEKRFAKVDL